MGVSNPQIRNIFFFLIVTYGFNGLWHWLNVWKTLKTTVYNKIQIYKKKYPINQQSSSIYSLFKISRRRFTLFSHDGEIRSDKFTNLQKTMLRIWFVNGRIALTENLSYEISSSICGVIPTPLISSGANERGKGSTLSPGRSAPSLAPSQKKHV